MPAPRRLRPVVATSSSLAAMFRSSVRWRRCAASTRSSACISAFWRIAATSASADCRVLAAYVSASSRVSSLRCLASAYRRAASASARSTCFCDSSSATFACSCASARIWRASLDASISIFSAAALAASSTVPTCSPTSRSRVQPARARSQPMHRQACLRQARACARVPVTCSFAAGSSRASPSTTVPSALALPALRAARLPLNFAIPPHSPALIPLRLTMSGNRAV